MPCDMIWATLAMLMTFYTIFSVKTGCQARRRLKATASSSVEAKPLFGMRFQNVSVGLGDRAVLKCRVDHLGTKTIVWRRENSQHPLTIGLLPFVTDPRLSADYDQRTNEWCLIIEEVRWSDDGLYQCQISTKETLEINSVEVMLSVQNIQVSGTEHVERGSPIQLVCNATGWMDAPHNVDWYKDGNRVNSDVDKGIIITKKIDSNMLVSVLVIRFSKMSDAGVYLCRSSKRHIAKLTVHILNVPAAVEKRGTNVKWMENGESRNQFFLLLLMLPLLNCMWSMSFFHLRH